MWLNDLLRETTVKMWKINNFEIKNKVNQEVLAFCFILIKVDLKIKVNYLGKK